MMGLLKTNADELVSNMKTNSSTPIKMTIEYEERHS
jgi:hypothetical protein